MLEPAFFIINILAITLLVGPLYYRRHHGRDLVTAYLVLNLGVFGVASVLGSTEVGIGVGMGLFGVLSIIRLRSTELAQHEVAYYFSSLSIGLICGLHATQPWVTAALITLILFGVAIVDSPRILAGSYSQTMRLDRAYADPKQARVAVEGMLPGKITKLTIVTVDQVNDSTLVDVRWRADKHSRSETHAEAGPWTVPMWGDDRGVENAGGRYGTAGGQS